MHSNISFLPVDKSMLLADRLSIQHQPVHMAFRNISKGRHNFRNHPVNSDRDKEWGGIGQGDKYFRLDAQKQGWTLNHPVHFGSVNLACEVFTVV